MLSITDICVYIIDDAGDNKESSRKNLFGQTTQVTQATQGQMSELLGLCSGKFATQNDITQKTGQKRKSPLDEDDESNSSFRLVSDEEEVRSTKVGTNFRKIAKFIFVQKCSKRNVTVVIAWY